MDRMEKLEQEVDRLSLAIRVGLAAIVLGFGVRAYMTLSRAGQYTAIIADYLEGGTDLPAITVFFTTFSVPILIGLAVLALSSLVLLFRFPKQTWVIPFAIAVAVAAIVLSELALFAFQMPLVRIISQFEM